MHTEQLLLSVSTGIHLFWYHDRRCHAVSDLPRVLFHVILWISDRMTPRSLHHPPHLPANTQDPHLYHTPISSGSGLPISTAEIWDACNYCTIFIYSNQLDPNLYFPEAPAKLLASSYLPGRHSRRLCFLIRPRLKLFQRRKKTVKLCQWLLEGERFPTKFCPNINTDSRLIQTWHSVLVGWAAGSNTFSCIIVSWHIGVQVFHSDFVVWKPLESYAGRAVILHSTNGATKTIKR